MMTLLKRTGGRGKLKEKEQEGTETDQTHRGPSNCKKEGTKTDWGRAAWKSVRESGRQAKETG